MNAAIVTGAFKERTMNQGSVPLSSEELAALFGFTVEELALNRDGRLSKRQRQGMFYRSWGYLMRGLVLVIIGTGAVIMLTTGAGSALERALLGAVIALLGVSAALLIVDAFHVLRPTVRTAHGALRRGDDPWRPSVLVGEQVLSISTRRWRRLPRACPGTYRAYADPTGRLLSIEPQPET